MPPRQSHRSAAATNRYHLRQHLEEHPSADIRVDASDNARIQSSSNIPIEKSTLPQSFPRFMDLPFEIRSQIYRCAIGDRTIHIDSRCRDETGDRDRFYYTKECHHLVPVGFRCQSRISDAEKNERYSKRGDPRYVLEDHDDAFALSCAHNACFHGNDAFIRGILTTWRLDLRLLRVSWEANREATRLFYSTNTFSFKDVPAIYVWLSKIPADVKKFVRSVHLEMSLEIPDACKYGFARSTVPLWTECLAERMTVDLPGIQSLSMVLHMMHGFVTCWRMAQAPAITAMVSPLKKLKDLRVLDVLIVDEVRPGHPCHQSYHSGDCGYLGFFERRIELREKWAEKIQDLVLGQGRT